MYYYVIINQEPVYDREQHTQLLGFAQTELILKIYYNNTVVCCHKFTCNEELRHIIKGGVDSKFNVCAFKKKLR